jgi:hypothetical protein
MAAVPSPIQGADLEPVTDGATACDKLAELAATRAKLKQIMDWMVEDDGTFTVGYLDQILAQLLVDATKKGWWVRSNPTTGILELLEYIPINALEPGSSADGDIIVYDDDAGEWTTQSSSAFHGPPTTGGLTVPDVSAGAVLSAAHGLTSSPYKFGGYIECTTSEYGYTVGDRITLESLSGIQTGGTDDTGAVNVWANSTSVGVTFAKLNNASALKIWRKDTYEKIDLTEANWKVMLWAEV